MTHFDETLSECLFWQYLSQVRIWVMSGQKLGHQVRSEEILVYTLEANFATRFWWNSVRIFVLTMSRPSSKMGHVRSKTRSPGQILGYSCLPSRPHLGPNFDETLLECLSWQYLGLVWIWVPSILKLGNQVKSLKILVYSLKATFATQFWWNFVKMFIFTISRQISKICYVWSKTRSPCQIL